MSVFTILILLWFTLLYTPFVNANGTYYIDEDDKGIFIETTENGSWYISQSDFRFSKPGSHGTYYLKTDKSGPYLKTDKHGNFYIDIDEDDNLKKQIREFNREQERLTESLKTQVVIKGNQVFVPVVLGYRGNEIQAELLLDTGASIIILHREIADQLHIKTSEKVEFMAVGGRTITTDITKLSYVALGPLKKKNLYVGVIDHDGPPVNYHGLLGMNFLSGLEYRIDMKESAIYWKP
jgi:predicted aspartyl protease